MRVLFDAYWWVEGPPSNRTVERELIQGWADAHPDDELTLMVPKRHLEAARQDAPNRARLVATGLGPHGVAAAVGAPLIARRTGGVDLIVTHNFAALFGRSAVFIHDVLFQSNPEWFTRLERCYFAGMPALAPRAATVLTSSRHEARRIAAFNPRLRTIAPIGLAVRTSLRTASPVRPRALPPVDGFLLTVGRLNVRKNLITTLTAALRSERVSPSRPLVVVGEPDGRSLPLPAPIRLAVDRGAVCILPSVNDAELSWLYRNATLFVFLSLDEGFGLTPVEALTFGCACVVSDIGVFHETLGDRVRYVAPLDADAAAAEIVAALDAGDGPSTPQDDWSWADSVRRLREAVHAF